MSYRSRTTRSPPIPSKTLHNGHSRDAGLVSAITCLRADHPAHTPVACDVLVEREHGRLLIRLADGVELDFDERELLTAAAVNLDAGRLAA